MFVKPVEEGSTPLKPKDLNTPPPPTSGSPKTPRSPPGPSEAENMATSQDATFAIPTVALDSDSIAFDMAACLASSLLGHVLFLKGQIPFPVVQMARMTGANTASRSSKKRVELMTAIDTLSSHLHTTFAALSDAFAHRHDATDRCGSQNADPVSQSQSQSLARAHMAFVVGPSVGTPRARVLLVLDGLEVRSQVVPEDLGKNSENHALAMHQEVDDQTCEAETASSPDDDDVIQNTDSESDASEPPPSRTPSPSPPPSCPTSPVLAPTPCISSFVAAPATPTPPEGKRPLGLSTSQRSTPRSMALPERTHAQEQQNLRAAERLLARTLTNACAEDDGGMSAELAPAPTHIFLRAPRRFTHPAWTPRQNYTRSLEGTLETFMKEVTPQTADESSAKKKALKTGVKTEGVWISCKSRKLNASTVASEPTAVPVNEEDEMIWWEWNGKIVGFSDW